MSKSRDAFRTISEVSEALDTPAHVLRFWESKFAQVKPVKRAGGRRYYRPGDMDLLAGIKQLLHDDGMTIKGAQKLMREKGIKHVTALGCAALDTGRADTIGAVETTEVLDATPTAAKPEPALEVIPEPALSPDPTVEPELEIAITNVVALPPSEPRRPSLTLDLAPKTEPSPIADVAFDTTDAVDAMETDLRDTTPPVTPDVPADPADADSKAPARLFHLLHKVQPENLAARAETIAPLLARMQVLRDRIDIR